MTQTKRGYQWDPDDGSAREGAPVTTQKVIETPTGAVVVAERGAAGPVLVSSPLDADDARRALRSVGNAGELFRFSGTIEESWPDGKVLAEVDAELAVNW